MKIRFQSIAASINMAEQASYVNRHLRKEIK